jgi:nucleoside phosphorylase
MTLAVDTHPGMTESILRATGAAPVDVATTLGVTVGDEEAALIAEATGAHIEHLEAHAVATATAMRGVPFAAVLGVANVVGSRAREEWRKNHVAASDAAADAVNRWLASLDSIDRVTTR